MSYAIVVPTYNPGAEWSAWVGAVARQSVKPAVVIVIDSSSTDGQIGSCEPSDWRIVKINTLEFDHGATRNKGFEMAARHDVDFIVSLTQDAILADPHAIERLLEPFADARVAAVCGRQLPRHDANARARFARLFNYPGGSRVNTMADIPERGIKTAFMSNSFAAYRLSAYLGEGGFERPIIFGEDMQLAARLILTGWHTVYCAEAKAIHSHNNGLKADFQRYFDMGVFHRQMPALFEHFGTATGEGFTFFVEEIKYVWHNNIFELPLVFLEVLTKFTAHHCGLNYAKIPNGVRRRLSLNKRYWMYG